MAYINGLELDMKQAALVNRLGKLYSKCCYSSCFTNNLKKTVCSNCNKIIYIPIKVTEREHGVIIIDDIHGK